MAAGLPTPSGFSACAGRRSVCFKVDPFGRKLHVQGRECEEAAFGGLSRVFTVGSKERETSEGRGYNYG